MHLELQQLARRHNTPAPAPHVELALPDCDGLHQLSGYCSVPVPDLGRICFEHRALSFWQSPAPKLTYRHGTESVGTVDTLEWRDRGRGLYVEVTTDHPLAKCTAAFSVEATIRKYHIVNPDSPDYYALVTSAWLDAIALTPIPANPSALVYDRSPCFPVAEHLVLIARQAGRTAKLFELMLARARAA